jgi:hypothetical protein
MASYPPVQDVGAFLSPSWKHQQVGRRRGGRRPVGGGAISRLSRAASHGRSWQSMSLRKLKGGAWCWRRVVGRTRGWGRGPARRGLPTRAFDLTP